MSKDLERTLMAMNTEICVSAGTALAAQREEIERLRNGLTYFIGMAFSEGFFDDEPEIKKRVRAFVLENTDAMDDNLTIGDVVKSIVERSASIAGGRVGG